MEWKKEFSVGIQEIDEQHKTLVDYITSIEQTVIGQERWLAVHSALDRAADFAQIHFAVEESLMRIHAYPRLEEHAAEHRCLSDYVATLQEKALTTDVSEEMVAFIQGWLEVHIPTHDMPYAAHFLTRMA